MNNIVKEFNKILIEFLEQTVDITGTKYLNKFKFVTRINNMYPIDRFIVNVIPYKNYIDERNEEFFLSVSTNDDELMEDIMWLKEIYFKLDDESKENVWDIVTALACLAEERHNLKNPHSHNHKHKVLPA